MKLPVHFVKTMNMRWPIKFPKDPAERAAIGRNFGLTEWRQGVIYLDEDQSLDNLKDTVLHEMIHAALHDAGVKRIEDDEEEYCRRTTPLLIHLLRSNPELREFILG
jgi:hypothetical protein